jgi:hypothetical protein
MELSERYDISQFPYTVRIWVGSALVPTYHLDRQSALRTQHRYDGYPIDNNPRFSIVNVTPDTHKVAVTPARG